MTIYNIICKVTCITCFVLTLTLARGNAQHGITVAQASLLTPSRVRFTCTATDPDILSVTWHDPLGNQLNSTSLTRLNEQESPSTTATLEIERENCHSAQYTCVFESELAASHHQAQVECPPIPVVEFQSSEYTVSESERALQVCVEVYNMTSGGLVTITEADHTASRRTDFTLLPTFNLTITPRQLTGVVLDFCAPNSLCGLLCFNIPITQDIVFEYDIEYFSLEVRARDALAQARSETTVYIQDDEVLVIGFDRVTLTVHEGDHECSPSVRVCAQINNVILGLPLLMVPVWRAGTATEGVDYHAPPCNFTFPSGGYVDCMDLTVVNDNVAELTETLSVSVGTIFVDGREVGVGDRVRSDGRETVIQITDDDVFELSLEESEYRIQEGGPGETHVALRVCLVQRQEGAQSVELEGGRDSLSVSVTLNTHDGTATAGYDFETLNTTISTTLPLASSVEVCECVRILRDQVVESTEQFDLNLQSSNPLVNTVGSRVLVRDNSQSDVDVGFERSEYTVSEADGSLEVCLSLSGSYQRSINVYLCTESVSATDNVDYMGIESHRLTFPADPFSPATSSGSVCLNITVMKDGLLENDERFLLTLQSSDTAVWLTQSTASVVILNDDGSLPSLTYIEDTPSVRGNEIRADFIITNPHQVSSLSCALSGPGRTPTITLNCSTGHVTFSNLPLRRQKFILTVNALLHSQLLNQPLLLSTVDLRLDHDVCWLHPINEGIIRDAHEERMVFEWQATGPHQLFRVSSFLCRRDRERTAVSCTSPYVWDAPSPGPHTLSVTPAPTTGCRRRISRRFDFIYTH